MSIALGDAIRSARLTCKLTQAQLSAKMAVTRAAISHWEKGLYRPEPHRLIELESILDTNLAELSAGDADKAAAKPSPLKGRSGTTAQSSLKDVSLVEVMSPYWQRNQIVVFNATKADSPEFDMLIKDFAFHMNDAAMVSGLLVHDDQSHGRGAKLMKLGLGSAARPDDVVLIVGPSMEEGRTARLGRLLEINGDHMFLRRIDLDRDEKVPLGECEAMFLVLTK